MTDHPESKSAESGTKARVVERRYSASHDGWFWRVEIDNPAPSRFPDGTPSPMDRTLVRSGFAFGPRRADWAIGRAARRLERLAAKARRIVAEERAFGGPSDG